MAARTSKTDQGRDKFHTKWLNDLSSVNLLYEETSKRKRTLNKFLGIFKAERLIAYRKYSGVKAEYVFF